jgi:WD40 repeat protein
MNANFLSVIKKIISDQGEAILAEPQRLKGWISDYAKDEPKAERLAFGRCIEYGAYTELKNVPAEGRAAVKNRLAQRLHSEEGLDTALCAGALDLLEAALFGVPEQKITCRNCGKELQAEWKACPYCGTSVVDTHTSVPASAPSSSPGVGYGVGLIEAALLMTLNKHSDSVRSVAYSPDGRRIVSGSDDGTIKIWDAESGWEIRTLTGDNTSVYSVAYSPDGRRIVSGSKDGTIKIWDAESGREIRTLEEHSDHVWSVAYSPDGRRIVSGADDETIKIWDAESGREIRTLAGHSCPVDSVAYSPDGRRIVSGSRDNTIKIWDAGE